MGRTPKKVNESEPLLRPAMTDDAKQSQLVSLAIDLAEQQLRDGTASSQVITHYLKLGTTQAKVELEKTKLENELVKAKTEALQASKHIEELYSNAILAMQKYSGQENNNDEYDR